MASSSWDAETAARVRDFMERQIPFNHLLGIECVSLSDGFARLEIAFRPELIGDPIKGALHGGVLSALIDTCGGAAVFTTIPFGDRVSTIDLRVDYLRPGRKERLVAEAYVLRTGGRVASVDVRAFHPDAPMNPVATGKGVYAIKRAKPVTSS